MKRNKDGELRKKGGNKRSEMLRPACKMIEDVHEVTAMLDYKDSS